MLVFGRFGWTPDARGPLENLGRRNPQDNVLIPCFSPNQHFPLPNLGPMEEEEAVRKRKMAQEPQAGEEEVPVPFPSVLLHVPAQHGPQLQDISAADPVLLGTHWGDLLALPSGTKANPILSLSFLPQTRS